MKSALLIVLLTTAGSLAQNAIPPGTILPVQLSSSLRSDRVAAGQRVSGRVMQDVPVSAHSRIPAGAKVIGHIVTAKPAGHGAPAEISLRFDTVAVGNQQIAVITNLLAAPMCLSRHTIFFETRVLFCASILEGETFGRHHVSDNLAAAATVGFKKEEI